MTINEIKTFMKDNNKETVVIYPKVTVKLNRLYKRDTKEPITDLSAIQLLPGIHIVPSMDNFDVYLEADIQCKAVLDDISEDHVLTVNFYNVNATVDTTEDIFNLWGVYNV